MYIAVKVFTVVLKIVLLSLFSRVRRVLSDRIKKTSYENPSLNAFSITNKTQHGDGVDRSYDCVLPISTLPRHT